MDFITSNFPWLAGIGTAITLGWSYVKQIFFHLRSILVRSVSLETDYHSHISSYPAFIKSRSFFKRIFKFDDRIQILSRNFNGEKIRYSLSDPNFYIGLTRNNFPVIVKLEEDRLKLTFIRGTFDVSLLIKDFEEYSLSVERLSNKDSRFTIVEKYGKLNDKISVTNGKDGEEPIQLNSKNESSDQINGLVKDYGFFITGKDNFVTKYSNCNIKNSIDFDLYTQDIQNKVKLLEHWVKNKQWFTDRDIPWNRSIRVEGVPGSGKSTFIVNLAKHLNLPIYKFHLATMDSKDFQEEWKQVTSSSPAIILLEDFDRLFNEDKSFKLEKLTLDTILNAISGANEYNGILTIITANFPERLDDALGRIENGVSTRPGRLDFLIEINELTEQGRRSIANKILDKFPETINSIVKDGEGETASQFSQRCIELAQNKFWEEFKP